MRPNPSMRGVPAESETDPISSFSKNPGGAVRRWYAPKAFGKTQAWDRTMTDVFGNTSNLSRFTPLHGPGVREDFIEGYSACGGGWISSRRGRVTGARSPFIPGGSSSLWRRAPHTVRDWGARWQRAKSGPRRVVGVVWDSLHQSPGGRFRGEPERERPPTHPGLLSGIPERHRRGITPGGGLGSSRGPVLRAAPPIPVEHSLRKCHVEYLARGTYWSRHLVEVVLRNHLCRAGVQWRTPPRESARVAPVISTAMMAVFAGSRKGAMPGWRWRCRRR